MNHYAVSKSHRRMACFLILALSLIKCAPGLCAEEGTRKVQYEYDWKSVKAHPVPKWFDDAKFGIFIHWGPWSVLEVAPWHLYGRAEQHYPYMKKRFGAAPPEFGVKDLIPMFTAKNWDPVQWSELFSRAGAKYVILTGEHHDGYVLGDSDLTPWCATKIGPKRDLVGDLAEAVRAKGMKFAPSYHRERHAGMFSKTKFIHSSPPYPDVAEEIRRVPEAAQLYGPFEYSDSFIEDYVLRWKEMERKYKPDFMWIDDIPFFYKDENHPQVSKFRKACLRMIADYYNIAGTWGKEVYINNKGTPRQLNWPEGVGCYERDRMRLDEVSDVKWQCPMTMGHAWYYSSAEEKADAYKSSTEIIHQLCDVVSKNGNFLLNIGPKPDGTIPNPMQKRLLAIGEWFKLNGEAIYGTRPWVTFGQKIPNMRFTTKGDVLYAIMLEQSREPFVIQIDGENDRQTVTEVSLLGSDKPLQWNIVENGIRVTPPKEWLGKHAWTFKIQINANK